MEEAIRAQACDRRAAVAVPMEALELFVRLLSELANGNAVSIMPVRAELACLAGDLI